MTKTAKRVLALLLVFSMAIVAPVKVDAKSYLQDKEEAVLYPKTSPSYKQKQIMKYSGQVKIGNIKNSKKSIATVSTGRDKASGQYVIYVQPKKTGTTTVTYNRGKVSYKFSLTVKKYQNPFKKITLNGKDITKKFDKSNVYNVDYKKYKGKTIKLSIKTKKSINIPYGVYLDKSNHILNSFDIPGSAVKFKVTKKNSRALFQIVKSVADEYSPAAKCDIVFK